MWDCASNVLQLNELKIFAYYGVHIYFINKTSKHFVSISGHKMMDDVHMRIIINTRTTWPFTRPAFQELFVSIKNRTTVLTYHCDIRQ